MSIVANWSPISATAELLYCSFYSLHCTRHGSLLEHGLLKLISFGEMNRKQHFCTAADRNFAGNEKTKDEGSQRRVWKAARQRKSETESSRIGGPACRQRWGNQSKFTFHFIVHHSHITDMLASRACAVAQYTVFEANAEVNGIGENSLLYSSQILLNNWHLHFISSQFTF